MFELAFVQTTVTGAITIAAGGFHTCAVVTGGTVTCWGLNDHGQIGDGSDGNTRPAPVAVAGLTDVVQLTAGDWFSCARRAHGEVWCWGQDDQGQTGTGSLGNDVLVPRLLTQLAPMTDLCVGSVSVMRAVSARDERLV